MRDLELACYFPPAPTRKPNGVFGHHEPRDPDRAKAGRCCYTAHRGEFTVDQPRHRMRSFVEGLDEFGVRIEPEHTDCLEMIAAHPASDLAAIRALGRNGFEAWH